MGGFEVRLRLRLGWGNEITGSPCNIKWLVFVRIKDWQSQSITAFGGLS